MQASEFISHAKQQLAWGQPGPAAEACERALQIDPNHAEAMYMLGIIHLQQGCHHDAVTWIGRAAAANPQSPETHANLGHALRLVGRLDEASTALERAISLRPGYGVAFNNLGLLRKAQGRHVDAVAAFQKAVELAPDLLAARMNLGNALRSINNAPAAIAVFRDALSTAPRNPDIHVALGGAFELAGDEATAAASYETALRLKPDHMLALVNLGSLLKKQGKIEASIGVLRKAVLAAPNSPDANERLGRSLWDAGLYDDGLRHFEQAVRIRPLPPTRIALATLIPPIYTSTDQVQFWRDRLVKEVAKLRSEGVTIDVTNHIARTPFYMPYAGLNDRDVMREIAHLHRPPADLPLKSRESDGKMRVAFISSLFKDQTVGLWTQGLIAMLPRDRFEVIVLSAGRHDDVVSRFIRQHAHQFIELPANLPASRAAIADLGLDVLLYADLGMDGFTYTLAFSRLAPVQCVMWGHPETSGIDTIDYFLSSDLAEAQEADCNYTEKLVRLPHLPLYYFRPPPAPVRTRADFNLPADAHVYGCLHATFKLHPEFDIIIGQLLRRDTKGLLLIPKTGASNWDRMVLERLTKAYPDVIERIRFIDRLPRDEFRALNTICDATLAPFPFGAGDTSLEAFAQGVPVVTMPTPHLRGRFTHAMYRAMEIEDCVAQTPEQYVEIAIRLATDHAWRESVRSKITERCGRLFENPDGVKVVADWLILVTPSTQPARG